MQGHKLDEAKKPSNFSWGETPTGKVKDAAKAQTPWEEIAFVKSPRDAASGLPSAKGQAPVNTLPEAAKHQTPIKPTPVEAVESPRDVATGQATGKKNPPATNKPGNVPTVEATKGTATVKPGVSFRKPTAYSDTETRSGVSLVLSGLIDMAKGVKAIATGNTENGFKLWGEGTKRVQTGSNGDPADNGKPLGGGKGGEGEGDDKKEGEGGEGK